jgi:hypothetical protein
MRLRTLLKKPSDELVIPSSDLAAAFDGFRGAVMGGCSPLDSNNPV